jgi:hypothetical protein
MPVTRAISVLRWTTRCLSNPSHCALRGNRSCQLCLRIANSFNCTYYYLLLFIASGVGLSPCTAATSGLLYQPQMIGEGDCGAISGMKIGRGNRSTRRKPAPAPLCPFNCPYYYYILSVTNVHMMYRVYHLNAVQTSHVLRFRN